MATSTVTTWISIAGILVVVVSGGIGTWFVLSKDDNEVTSATSEPQKVTPVSSELDAFCSASDVSTTSSGIKETFTPMEERLGLSVFETYCSSSSGEPLRFGITEEGLIPFHEGDYKSTACSLYDDRYSTVEVPTALNYTGLYYQQAGRFDEGLKFYRCAAEKYYETTSIYRIAQVYYNGTDRLKANLPNLNIQERIEPDIEKAYFWIVVYFHTLNEQQTYSYAYYNAVALLDELQNASDLTSSDLVRIEDSAKKYLAQEYSGIYDSGFEVSAHSIQSYIDALEGMQSN
ncbi:MAG: hypothetical protein Q8P93_04775 [bacterium]|nr:hypothetical protein [bacterium]